MGFNHKELRDLKAVKRENSQTVYSGVFHTTASVEG